MWPALYLDCETSDFHTAKDPSLPVQIALILALEDRVLATLAAILDQRAWVGIKVNPIASRVISIHHVTPDLCNEFGWAPDLVLGRLRAMLAAAVVVVGHNVSFDVSVIDHAMATQHLPRLTWPEQFCTMAESAAIVQMPSVGRFSIQGYKPPKLVEAYRFFARKDMTNAHDALADAYGSRFVHRSILKHREKNLAPA